MPPSRVALFLASDFVSVLDAATLIVMFAADNACCDKPG